MLPCLCSVGIWSQIKYLTTNILIFNIRSTFSPFCSVWQSALWNRGWGGVPTLPSTLYGLPGCFMDHYCPLGEVHLNHLPWSWCGGRPSGGWMFCFPCGQLHELFLHCLTVFNILLCIRCTFFQKWISKILCVVYNGMKLASHFGPSYMKSCATHYSAWVCC